MRLIKQAKEPFVRQLAASDKSNYLLLFEAFDDFLKVIAYYK